MDKDNQQRLKFLVGDDHNLIRLGVSMIIEDLTDDPDIVQASTLKEVLHQLNVHRPDYAILDAEFPDGNCYSILPQIRSDYPDLHLMVFTGYEEEKYALTFIKAGADGFLSKLSEEAQIREALESLIQTGMYLSELTQRLLQAASRDPGSVSPLERLSERELLIAKLYARGMGNLEIANELSLRQNTVSTYKKRIFDKLGISTLVELIELMKLQPGF